MSLCFFFFNYILTVIYEFVFNFNPKQMRTPDESTSDGMRQVTVGKRYLFFNG